MSDRAQPTPPRPAADISKRKGKRSGLRSTPKGRRVDPVAREEVQALLGDAPRRRDLLILSADVGG